MPDKEFLSSTAIIFCNQALCFLELKEWESAVLNAGTALTVDGTNSKARFRLKQGMKMLDFLFVDSTEPDDDNWWQIKNLSSLVTIEYSDDEASTETWESFKARGNVLYGEKKYRDAVHEYRLALRILLRSNDDLASSLISRSSASMKQGISHAQRSGADSTALIWLCTMSGSKSDMCAAGWYGRANSFEMLGLVHDGYSSFKIAETITPPDSIWSTLKERLLLKLLPKMSTKEQRLTRDSPYHEYLATNVSADENRMCNKVFSAAKGRYPDFVSLANYPDEFFADKVMSANVDSCNEKKTISDEYECFQFNYYMFREAYATGVLPKKDLERELSRRLLIYLPEKLRWFHSTPPLGDVFSLPPHLTHHIYDGRVSGSMSNCLQKTCTAAEFGLKHVAIGFVDLGILLNQTVGDSITSDEFNVLHYYGYESSAYCVAKSEVLWEMIKCDSSVGSSEVMQVWYSCIWTKRTAIAFIAASKRISDSNRTSRNVSEIISHWSHSKGIGLKKAKKNLCLMRKEKSHAIFFERAIDRIAMVRYYLTGEFGLAGEAACSGSIAMFDLFPGTPPLERGQDVFNTLSVEEIAQSRFWEGNYFEAAEAEKRDRISNMIDFCRSEKIVLTLKHVTVDVSKIEEISTIQPDSVSWSNVLDYSTPSKFHQLARDMTSYSKSTTHFGYSINWPSSTFGTSIIDYCNMKTAFIMKLLKKSQAEFEKSLFDACTGRDQIFSSPVRQNPVNTTAPHLRSKFYNSWLICFFTGFSTKFDSVEDKPNPLSQTNSLFMVWKYDEE